MEFIKTVIVGAGQAGLALSRSLTDAGEEHIVLERGQVAERWRSERWDSFRLLTPNWQTRLPGYRYRGPDPDGFMGRSAIVDFFDGYAQSFAAPVRTGVTVLRVEPIDTRWRVITSVGTYLASNVVIATGHYDVPRLPLVANRIAGDVDQLLARNYRNPATLSPGGVLVVGAGPTGQQIADELALAGRRVFIAVGRHRPLPRRYRGYDAYWWLDRMGSLNRPIDTLSDPAAAANAPSVVLSGGVEDLHLRRLVDHGVTPLGHLTRVDDTTLHAAPDLDVTLAEADRHGARFRDQVDEFVRQHRIEVPAGPSQIPLPLPRWAHDSVTTLDLTKADITTVVWATGYGRDHSWIAAPVFSATGAPIQRRGITPAPGLMFLGLRFMHRRNSNFIDGVGADATYLADSISSAARTAA
jgi:putative flavoprotein involved in K+ transport